MYIVFSLDSLLWCRVKMKSPLNDVTILESDGKERCVSVDAYGSLHKDVFDFTCLG